jgi:hypothetical protein
VNVLTGNFKVGNGTPTLTLNGEDAYVEGTLEVDGVLNTATYATIAGGIQTSRGSDLYMDGSWSTFDLYFPSINSNETVIQGSVNDLTMIGGGANSPGVVQLGNFSGFFGANMYDDDANWRHVRNGIQGYGMEVGNNIGFSWLYSAATNGTNAIVTPTQLMELGGDGALILLGDMTVNGADIITTSTLTGSVFNTNLTTLNIGGATTALNLAGGSGSTGCTIDGSGNLACSGDYTTVGADLITTAATAAVFNTTATTLNIGGATTALNLAGGSGSTGCTIDGSGNLACSGDLAVTGNDITGTSTLTANVFNTNTTGNVNIGNGLTSGSTWIGGTGAMTGTIHLGVGTGAQTINLGTGGTGIKTINIGTGAVANPITIGSTTSGASVTLQANASNLVNILTGNLKVGNGTPSLTLNGEDAYVEGTLEVDGVLNTATYATIAGGIQTNSGADLYMNGSWSGHDMWFPDISSSETVIQGSDAGLIMHAGGANHAGAIQLQPYTAIIGEGLYNDGSYWRHVRNTQNGYVMEIGQNTGIKWLLSPTTNGTNAIVTPTELLTIGGSGNMVLLGDLAVTGNDLTGTTTLAASLFTTHTTGAINLGTGLTSGALTLGGTGAMTGNINLGTGTGAQTINLGTGGTGAKTLSVGSTAASSSVTVNAPATGLVNVLTGNFKVGNGTPTLTLNGEDAYVEGTLEVDGAVQFDGVFTNAVSSATVANFNRTTNDGTIISIQQDGTEEGTIAIAGNTVSYNAFTGSHYAWTDQAIDRHALVSLTGINRHLHGSDESEILYGIQVSSAANDARALGAYLSVLEPAMPASDDNPHMVMSVGNGGVWIVDAGADLSAGDYLVTASVAGHAMRDDASFPVSHVIGRLTEDIDWDMIATTLPDGTKHTVATIEFGAFDRTNASSGLAFVGTYDDGGAGLDYEFGLSLVPSAASSHLAFTNGVGTEVARLTDSGDLHLTGRLYLSDRGAMQSDAYLYYDGSDPSIGYINTNAAGFGTGSYDFAETFPSVDDLEAGELVMVDTARDAHVKRADDSRETNGYLLAGIVSTRPGFLAGVRDVGHFPVALKGRVPTKVNLENGPIAIGDPISISTEPGVGMKADAKSYVVGIALQAYDGTQADNLITVFLKVGWYNGSAVEASSESVAGEITTEITGALDMKGQPIIGIGALAGLGDSWSLDSEGRFVIKEVRADKVVTKETTVSIDDEVQMTGASLVQVGNSEVRVHNPSVHADSRVFITFYGNVEGSWWIDERVDGAFMVKLSKPASTDLRFEYWIVNIEDKRTVIETIAPEVLDEVLSAPTPLESPATVSGENSNEGEPDETPADEEAVTEPADEGSVTDDSASIGEEDAVEQVTVEEPADNPIVD